MGKGLGILWFQARQVELGRWDFLAILGLSEEDVSTISMLGVKAIRSGSGVHHLFVEEHDPCHPLP